MPVVADEQHRALVVLQRLLEHLLRRDVQVVLARGTGAGARGQVRGARGEVAAGKAGMPE